MIQGLKANASFLVEKDLAKERRRVLEMNKHKVFVEDFPSGGKNHNVSFSKTGVSPLGH